MTRLEARLFGPFEVSLNGRPATGFDSDKVRALLAYLVVEADRPHRREKLAGLLWPDFPERSARTNLRRALSNLRQVIGDREADPPFLFISRQTVQFNVESDAWTDVTAFSVVLKSQASKPPTAAQLEEASGLFRGIFLEGFSLPDSAAFEEWQRLTRESFQEQAVQVLRRAAAAYEGAGQYDPAIELARRRIELEPYQEEAYQQLMRLLALSGRRSDALAQFEVLREVLADELNVEPSAESIALYERLRTRDAERVAPGVGRQTVRGYALRELIGRGHFGAVYRAHQGSVGRDVAIKIILPHYADDPDFIRRFEIEAQLVARLEHPAIVPLYDYWREPGGAFLVMRWLRGGSLQEALARGPWNLEPAVRLVDQVASALNVAHRQGVIHRDIKPGNILLDEEGNAYLSDFGVASLIGPLAAMNESLPASSAAESSGSLGYRAPEIIRHGPITIQTDIYSFGVVLYELIGAQHPFPGHTDQDLLDKHLHEQLPSVLVRRPELPPAVDEVIRKATAKEPGERYVDAQALAAAFRQAVESKTAASLPVRITVKARNPYKGLRAFQAADSSDFFGRETLSKQLLNQLQKDRFLALVGPSGSGKSSVVKAGVIPALRQGALPGSREWFIAEMTPGSRPMEELETALLRIAVNPPESLLGQMAEDPRGILRSIRRALPDDDSRLLLVIDQFEELFTLVEDAEQQNRFLNGLLGAIEEQDSPVRLLITLRADYYDRPLQYAGFGELMRQYTEVVLPLSHDELEQAIVGPAEQVGLLVEPGLVAEIIAGVVDQPGTLPLLQYALTELFEQREDNQLTQQTYQAIGGVTGAMARRAEELYAHLSSVEQEAVRQIFLRLVTLGEDGEYSRRRVLRSELMSLDNSGSSTKNAQIGGIVDAYGLARLLTFDRDASSRAPTVEVAHEAMLREWGRLQGWLEENRSDLILHSQLNRAAAEWSAAGGDASFLLRGERLTQFESWARESQLALSADERAYLEASIARREERAAAERQRQEQEVRLKGQASQRLRALVVVMAVALVVAVGLMIAAVSFARQAEEQEQVAQENERLALARELTSFALANLESDPELGVLLALEAAETAYLQDGTLHPEVEDLLHRAAQADLVRYSIRMGGVVALSPDGTVLAIGNKAGQLRLWDAMTGQDLWGQFRHQDQKIEDIAFSPDGRFLLTSGADTPIRIWDVVSSQEVGNIEAHGGIRGFAFSPDSRGLVTTGLDGVVRLWDLEPVNGPVSEDAQPVELVTSTLVWKGPSETTHAIYSPDGRQVAILVPGKNIIVLEVGSWKKLLEITGIGSLARGIAFSPEGDHLAGRTSDLEATIWDARTGEEILTIRDASTILDVSFSPDGRYLASATENGKVTLWDRETGREVRKLSGHSSGVNSLSFNHDGHQLATSSDDGTTRVWDVDPVISELFSIAAHGGEVYDAVYSPQGNRIATAGDDGAVKLWDADTGNLLQDLPGQIGWVHFPTFSPDGAWLAAANQAGGISIWDVDSGRQLQSLDGDAQAFTAVTFSPDGTRLAAGGLEGIAHVWDAATGQRLVTFRNDTGTIMDLVYSPDGDYIVSFDWSGLAASWDAENGQRLTQPHEGEVCEGTIWDAEFSPDGQLQAVVGADTQVHVFQMQRAPADDLEDSRLYRLSGHVRDVKGVAFNHDSSILATSSSDGTVRVWDMATGKEKLKLIDQALPLNGVDISPDGRYLVAAGSDGTISVYVMSIEELMQVARSRLSRGFIHAECRAFLHLDRCPEGP